MNPTKIQIPQLVYDKIMWMVDNADNCEVSGLCKLIHQDGVITVVDTALPKQTNSSAETEMDPNGIGKVMFLLKDKPGELCGHWHSHVNMDVFWSSTDMEMIKQNAKHSPWFVHMVFNKKRESLACLYVKAPFELFVDKIPVTVISQADSEMQKKWNKEYVDAVEIKKWETTTTGHWADHWSDRRGWITSDRVSGPSEAVVQGGHVEEDDDRETLLLEKLVRVEAQIESIEEQLDKCKKESLRHRLEATLAALENEQESIELQIRFCDQTLLAGGLE